jgi:hypothetical protein
MQIQLRSNRPVVCAVLLVLLFLGLFCALDTWARRSPWMHCHDSSCIHCRGHLWSVVGVRWCGEQLECECCLKALQPRPSKPDGNRPRVARCFFHDQDGRLIKYFPTQDVTLSDAFLSGRSQQATFRFQVPVPQGARAVSVQFYHEDWKTRYVNLPPKPAGSLERLLTF